jgi:beta-lactamase class A
MQYLNKNVYLSLFLIAMVCAATPIQSSAEDSTNDSIRQLLDNDLQQQLEHQLGSKKNWSKLVSNNKMAVCLVDLNGQTPRFANVNGDHMMYAASLPKIAILLAAYVAFEDGSLKETPEVHKDLTAMIRVSSNSAATRMIDRLGFKKIQSVLKDSQYQFYDENDHGGLWVGKRYASDGPRSGDPLYNISHGATANQVCRFFYMLTTGQLINPQRSAQMLEDLAKPKLHHKFVSQIERRAPRAAVFRKSGSWRQWHADAILVRGVNWRNYILVGIVENSQGEQIIRNLLPAVEELIAPKPIN